MLHPVRGKEGPVFHNDCRVLIGPVFTQALIWERHSSSFGQGTSINRAPVYGDLVYALNV